MSTKTNKSFRKRINVTRTGKVLRRSPGQNHFNAKSRRVRQLSRKGWILFRNGKKAAERYLPYN